MGNTIIEAGFADLISGRNADFKRTTFIYPKIETQRHDWKVPFKEGGNPDVIDEVKICVSTLKNGVHYAEWATVHRVINDNDIIKTMSMIKARLEFAVRSA